MDESPDVILIGAGIMSATLGVMLKEVEPAIRIHIFEKLDSVAEESSDAWNNAGTGHSAFCELNYTPVTPAGIDIARAVKIADDFEVSREFWAYLVEKRNFAPPGRFIRRIPHMSCVWGDENIQFLFERHKALIAHPLFREMSISSDPSQLKEWMPLVMEGRNSGPMAATFMPEGTDVNFGALTRYMFSYLIKQPDVSLHLNTDVRKIRRRRNGWQLTVKDVNTNKRSQVQAPFVFIGAGGGALPLLQKSSVSEAKGFGGFPVSGQWLICTNKDVINRHYAKVYGKADKGTPPMSVPHLDSRIISGERNLLFGPYAGLTTRFLKQGSGWDLLRSIRPDNIFPIISAGLRNLPLTRYLFRQVTLSQEERMNMLRVFMPLARDGDWQLAHAGQRVQVIKKGENGGVLEFGTELVSSADNSLCALLGASPGASVAVSIMLGLFRDCFPDRIKGWEARLREMIPSYGLMGTDRESHYPVSRLRTSAILELGQKQ
jgi:malate dehydrogenase (quinone)